MAFTDTMIRWVRGVKDAQNSIIMRRLFEPLFDRSSSLVVTTAGLVINGAGTKVAKIGATDCYFFANGIPGKLAAAAVMPALVGTVLNGAFNVFALFVDSAGTVTSAIGTAGSTYAKVVFPQLSSRKAFLGFIIINPTGTGNFVGGTTNLDDGTVVPNAVFISVLSGFDPACVWGF